MNSVLIIEDDVILGDDLKFFVEDAGYDCSVYDSADQVIDNLDSIGQYKVIVLDIMMMKGNRIPSVPKNGETGEELYRIIRSKYPTMKFIILSAKDYSKMSIDFAKEFNVEILSKPVVESVIIDLIGKIKKA